jgi:hypothetical protein
VSLVYDSHTDNRYSPYISYDVGENLSFAFSASFGRAFGVYSLHGYTRDDQWYNPFLDDAYR